MVNQLREIKISYSRPKSQIENQITSSKSAEKVLRTAFELTGSQMDLQERFFILLLSRSNHVLGYHLLSSGGTTGTVADVKLAFGLALKCAASAMIIGHNHPSGALRPSQADLRLTENFKKAGELLECPVLDHLILTSEGYYSFADDGKL